MEFDKSKLEWLEYDSLSHYPHVLHGTFSRHGGISQGKYQSLNLGEQTSDNREAVKINRDLVRKALGVSEIIYPNQSHGTNIKRINGKNREEAHKADALFTTEKGVGLAVTHADCQAAIFYDPIHEAIAIAHCGWRGSAQNIYARVIETLQREVGSQPHTLKVCISPSLGPDHAEFKNYKYELPKELWDFQTKSHYFNFWDVSKMQLTKSGILEKNIEIAELCSACEIKDYFSHRKEKDTGRNVTVVAIKS